MPTEEEQHEMDCINATNPVFLAVEQVYHHPELTAQQIADTAGVSLQDAECACYIARKNPQELRRLAKDIFDRGPLSEFPERARADRAEMRDRVAMAQQAVFGAALRISSWS